MRGLSDRSALDMSPLELALRPGPVTSRGTETAAGAARGKIRRGSDPGDPGSSPKRSSKKRGRKTKKSSNTIDPARIEEVQQMIRRARQLAGPQQQRAPVVGDAIPGLPVAAPRR